MTTTLVLFVIAGFITGEFVGVAIGVFVCALCAAASDGRGA